MRDVESIDETSTEVHVSAVSVLIPEDDPMEGFNVFTVLVETDDGRHLLGYDEDEGGWLKFWSGGRSDPYAAASEEWMSVHYSDRIASNERVDYNDMEEGR